jgi:hypothetical protein
VTPAVRRRTLLALAAAGGLALTGCRWGPPPPGPVELVVASVPLPEGPLRAAFDAAHPSIRLAFAPAGPRAPQPSAVGCELGRLGSVPPARLLPLGELLSLESFTPTAIDPAVWRLGQVGGQPRAVPCARARLAVAYDAARLGRLGLPRPERGWDLAGFLDLCRRLAARGERPLGRQGAEGALAVALALLEGFGAPLPTDPRAPERAPEAAIQALVAWAEVRWWTAEEAWAPEPGAPVLGLRFGILAAEARAWARAGAVVGLARFPRLPVRPVVPARAWGHGALRGGPSPGAALTFLAWSGEYDGQRLVRALGLAPVLADLPPAPPELLGGVDPEAVLPSSEEDRYLPAALALDPARLQALWAAWEPLRAERLPPAAAAAAWSEAVARLRGTSPG